MSLYISQNSYSSGESQAALAEEKRLEMQAWQEEQELHAALNRLTAEERQMFYSEMGGNITSFNQGGLLGNQGLLAGNSMNAIMSAGLAQNASSKSISYVPVSQLIGGAGASSSGYGVNISPAEKQQKAMSDAKRAQRKARKKRKRKKRGLKGFARGFKDSFVNTGKMIRDIVTFKDPTQSLIAFGVMAAAIMFPPVGSALMVAGVAQSGYSIVLGLATGNTYKMGMGTGELAMEAVGSKSFKSAGDARQAASGIGDLPVDSAKKVGMLAKVKKFGGFESFGAMGIYGGLPTRVKISGGNLSQALDAPVFSKVPGKTGNGLDVRKADINAAQTKKMKADRDLQAAKQADADAKAADAAAAKQADADAKAADDAAAAKQADADAKAADDAAAAKQADADAKAADDAIRQAKIADAKLKALEASIDLQKQLDELIQLDPKTLGLNNLSKTQLQNAQNAAKKHKATLTQLEKAQEKGGLGLTDKLANSVSGAKGDFWGTSIADSSIVFKGISKLFPPSQISKADNAVAASGRSKSGWFSNSFASSDNARNTADSMDNIRTLASKKDEAKNWALFNKENGAIELKRTGLDANDPNNYKLSAAYKNDEALKADLVKHQEMYKTSGAEMKAVQKSRLQDLNTQIKEADLAWKKADAQMKKTETSLNKYEEGSPEYINLKNKLAKDEYALHQANYRKAQLKYEKAKFNKDIHDGYKLDKKYTPDEKQLIDSEYVFQKNLNDLNNSALTLKKNNLDSANANAVALDAKIQDI
ncbi:MAG: hypothetical protein AAGI66_10045, partial [Cyanobacteria bacterium P01_H01_bin.74]